MSLVHLPLHTLDLGPVQRITGGFAMYAACSSCGWARTAILPAHELPRGTFASPEEVLDAMLISGHSENVHQRSTTP